MRWPSVLNPVCFTLLILNEMNNPAIARWIFAGNALMFVALATMLMAASRRHDPVLTVERINIVDSTGTLALVLSNAARLPGGMFEGKEYPQYFTGRGRSAGLLFYNEVGDEVGGLIYEGRQQDSMYTAFGHLSFDQWEQNQVVAVQYSDNGASRSAGLRVCDRPTNAPLEAQFALAERVVATPTGPIRDSLDAERLRVRERVAGTQRLFLGSRDREALLELRDPDGNVRLRVSVDSSGVARLVVLDAIGDTTAIFPE